MNKISIKDRLYELSVQTGDSQIEIARKSNVPKSSMSLYFNGKRIPRQDIIGKISDAYNIDPAWLMGYDVPMAKRSITESFNLNQASLLSQIRNRPKVEEAVIELLKLSDEDIEFYTENFKRINRGKE